VCTAWFIIPRNRQQMAHVQLNPILLSLSGRIGSLVFYPSRGNQYVRRYVIPCNPDTPVQRIQRELFAQAVSRWQTISESTRIRWNNKARATNRTGYNLFISAYLRIRKGILTGKSSVSSSLLIQSLSVYASLLPKIAFETHYSVPLPAS
jgi:hypothetical protein